MAVELLEVIVEDRSSGVIYFQERLSQAETPLLVISKVNIHGGDRL
jgi:hypothetical protein